MGTLVIQDMKITLYIFPLSSVINDYFTLWIGFKCLDIFYRLLLHSLGTIDSLRTVLDRQAKIIE